MKSALLSGACCPEVAASLVKLDKEPATTRDDLAARAAAGFADPARTAGTVEAVTSYILAARTNDERLLAPLLKSAAEGRGEATGVFSMLKTLGTLHRYEDVIRTSFENAMARLAAAEPAEKPAAEQSARNSVKFLASVGPLSRESERCLARALAYPEMTYCLSETLKQDGMRHGSTAEVIGAFHKLASAQKPNTDALYSFDDLIKKNAPAYVALFEDCKRLILHPNEHVSYRGLQVLLLLPLSEPQLRGLLPEMAAAAKESDSRVFSHVSELVAKKSPRLFAGLRGALVSMVIDGNNAYAALEALKHVGITRRDRAVLEMAKKAAPEGESTYYIRQTLELQAAEAWLRWPAAAFRPLGRLIRGIRSRLNR